MRSWSWPWFKHVLIKNTHDAILKERDPASHDILTKNDVVFICTLCFDTKQTFLYNCFKVPTPGQRLLDTSNHNRHIETCHKKFFKQLEEEGKVRKNKAPINKMVVAKGVKQAQAKAKGGRMVSASKSDGVSVLTGTQTTGAIHHIFSNLKTAPNAHLLNITKVASACLEELHRLEVKCATNNNISQRAVTDRACPEWRNMIEYAIVNGALLSKQFTVKERFMGRHKFSGIWVFEYLIGAIREV